MVVSASQPPTPPLERMILIATLCLLLTAQLQARNAEFPYAPAEWRTLLCFPEDPCKTLVDHQGTLLYEYGKGGGEFAVRLSLTPCKDALWKDQNLVSPRLPIVVTRKASHQVALEEYAFALRGKELNQGITKGSLSSMFGETQRVDAILTTIRNIGATPITLTPRVSLFTVFKLEREKDTLCLGNGACIITSSKITGAIKRRRGDHEIPLAPITLPAGATTNMALCYSQTPLPEKTIQIDALRTALKDVTRHWLTIPLPYDRLTVPDKTIQALLESSIRTIWQSREHNNGAVLFQPGPTIYRGFWIVDAAFIAEAATMLGAIDEARTTLEGMLAYQQEHGGIQVIPEFPKENGIALWAFCRHARLTNDRQWLRSQWPRLERIAAHIAMLRRDSCANEATLNRGLMPPGRPDGGQWEIKPEYSNSLWNMVGLRSFAEASEWLGDLPQQRRWESEGKALREAFERAAKRDLRKDGSGNTFLPNYMGGAYTNDLPQRGLWSLCQAVYPGELFPRDDPIVTGTLAMLQTTEQEGMVVGTGWHETGIWSYFASFYAHAWLWRGDARKAMNLLYAFARHASPTLLWSEEQSLKEEPHRRVGDMPHAWAGAEFLRLTIHLLALERGTELHLLEGLPSSWTKPGMTTRLNRIATSFGKLTATLTFTECGTQAHLDIAPLPDTNCVNLVVHAEAWSGKPRDVIHLNPRTSHNLSFGISSKE